MKHIRLKLHFFTWLENMLQKHWKQKQDLRVRLFPKKLPANLKEFFEVLNRFVACFCVR